MLSRILAALPVLHLALVVQMADAAALAEPTRVLSSFKVDPLKSLFTLHCHRKLPCNSLKCISVSMLQSRQAHHVKGVLPTCASVQCLLDDGLAEHRICQYHNLVLYRAKFLYIYQGEPGLLTGQASYISF